MGIAKELRIWEIMDEHNMDKNEYDAAEDLFYCEICDFYNEENMDIAETLFEVDHGEID